MLGASGVFSGYWLYRNGIAQATYEASARDGVHAVGTFLVVVRRLE